MSGASSMAVLDDWLADSGAITVAVSGGVDSTTLAVRTHQVLGRDARLVHAVSPAVPAEATRRLRRLAEQYGWNYSEVDAGEMRDPRYTANPVDRCYFCKQNLYSTVKDGRSLVVSGTNTDDLGDYRPGLAAARERGVRHPFVELGMSKRAVRELASELGLDELADLPASPCLASRVTTGIPIERSYLDFIGRAEMDVSQRLGAVIAGRSDSVVRVRLGRESAVVSLDGTTLSQLTVESKADILARVSALADEYGIPRPTAVREYVRGEAFVHG